MAKERPLWAQGLTFPARVDRQFIESVWPTEGVITGMAVSQHGAGDFTVDVALGRCVVKGDDQTNQGSYLGAVINAAENVTIGAAPGANSRIDLIVARVYDPDAGTGASPIFALECIAGTAAPSPVPPATPNTAIVLAHILVDHTTSAILTANITDKRLWVGGNTIAPRGLMAPRKTHNNVINQCGTVITAPSQFQNLTWTADSSRLYKLTFYTAVSWAGTPAGTITISGTGTGATSTRVVFGQSQAGEFLANMTYVESGLSGTQVRNITFGANSPGFTVGDGGANGLIMYFQVEDVGPATVTP